MRAFRLPLLFAATFSVFSSFVALPACADELRVLAAGAIAPIVRTVAADFERRSGIHVTVDNATGGVVDKRVRSGAAADVVVAPDGVLRGLGKDGYLNLASERPIARVGIAVAVRQGAPSPAIATVAQFRKALLDAPSVAVIDPKAGGSSGIYLEKLFERLGIAGQMHAKEVLVPGGLVAEKLVDGSAALALHQQSEILLVKGAKLVGPLPADIQNYTVYVGAVGARTASGATGRAFLTMFGEETARRAMVEHGLLPEGD
ncbi:MULTISPECIES: molybdate ABC transporter substrate-binding protein [Herbaspirillum]|uniref:molybdate ABC transporter substrate-binding protein n=1 Tax=Herbaspirillum TaxID=963 RepID=UPI00034A74C8|nr:MULTISPECIES: substrate-binding domain-containing protein [Herbaspirillum]MEE1638959.1 substrate-binding domain-containing protein [Herbaspirillum huttiense NC40101]UWE17101.1 substrate-binding domain-containing protein [Herbaspirillum huttiense]